MNIESWIVTTANWLCVCGGFCTCQYTGLKVDRATCTACKRQYTVMWKGRGKVSVSEIEKGGGYFPDPQLNR